MGDETWDVDMDLLGLVLVPGEISGISNSLVISLSQGVREA